MSFTKVITMMSFRSIVVVSAAAALLGGCVQASSLDRDFGRSLRENTAAQIADPDARYKGDPDPGSNGSRVALAQQRYITGKVIKPITASASAIASSGAGALAPAQE